MRAGWGWIGALLLACGAPAPVDLSGPVADWPEYGGDKGGLRYSPLTQITPENVADLEVAWVHHSGDVSDGSDGSTRTSFNATPLVVGDTLYYCTAYNRVIALDAETRYRQWWLLQPPAARACERPGVRRGGSRQASQAE